MRYYLIVTEGHQDIEFLIRLLKIYGVKNVSQESKLDPFWKILIPRSFPIDDDLKKRVPVPIFVQNSDVSIALRSVNGVKNLAKILIADLAKLDSLQLDSIAIILDADSEEIPQIRFNKLMEELTEKFNKQKKSLSVTLPLENLQLGEVKEKSARSPAFGVFILPDNQHQGTLEDILSECARENYANLYDLAIQYINNIDRKQLTEEDLKELNKPTGENKAILSSIVSILKPTRTIQVSLQDNRWIDDKTLNLPSIQLIKEFLDKIIRQDY